MSLPEEAFAARIVDHLDQAAAQLDARTAARLAQARSEALAHYGRPARPAWLEGVLDALRPGAFGARHFAAFAVLVLVLLGVAHWQSVAPVNDLAEIDAALLTGELPVHAYLDKDFHTWLERSSR